MSHFTQIKTRLADRQPLLAALADLGFGSDKVEVYDYAQDLHRYNGEVQGEQAEIIVRRKHLNRWSNDIGFSRQEDGTFMAILDSSYHDQEWVDQLTQRYTYHATVAQLSAQGFSIVAEENENGEIALTFMRS